MVNAPGMSVVVLSYRNERTIGAAVESLLTQDEPAEIVISHSGGGPTPALLKRDHPGLQVVESGERRLPGAARNAGLAATRSPYVAFLAGDCRAAAGWVANRLARHRAGADAVASAVAPLDRSASSLASYALLHGVRYPDGATPPTHRLGGVSYSRELLERFGPFHEEVEIGEDSELNGQLLGAGVEIAWVPEVLTLHAYPRSVTGLLTDQWTRGARTTSARPSGNNRRGLARWGPRATSRELRRSLRTGMPVARRKLPFVGPLMIAGGLARAAGTVVGRPRSVNGASDFLIRPLLRAPVPSSGLRKSRRQVRLIAVAPIRNERAALPGFLRNVEPHVDGIIVYDDDSSDGSGEWLAAQPHVLEVVRAPNGRTHWDPRPVMRALNDAALRQGADWILRVEADLRLERDFRLRAERVIRRGRQFGFSAYAIRLRELWDSPDTFRSDGVWGSKWRPWLFRARADHVFDDRALHPIVAPLQAKIRDVFPRGDLLTYHLGMIRPGDREERRRKYEALDPEARWQPELGYAYLTDERGLRLRRVRRSRAYVE